MTGKVNWYGRSMLIRIQQVSDEILTMAAFQAEAEAKPGASVDTGFMRNALYGIGPTGDHRAAAEAEAQAAADRPLASQPTLKPHEAALHGAAGYTIYQEIKHGFMYSGMQKAVAAIAQIIQQAGKSL